VQRPSQIGAALAGASSETIEALARFGSPLGRAFQYRDDLLGVFGDPLVTGKPAGDDLREGKRTMMVAYALADAPGSQAAELEQMLGDPSLTQDQIERAREIITDCGARQQVEQTIERGLNEALETLDGLPLTDAGRTALVTLAHASVRRDS
jgi:geranylgeranyl diphosphate synthase, type I